MKFPAVDFRRRSPPGPTVGFTQLSSTGWPLGHKIYPVVDERHTAIIRCGMAIHPDPAHFPETRWSVVFAVRSTAGDGRGAQLAMEAICERYWYPLYAFARRGGLGMEDAKDATQGFFARLIEKEILQAADRERGKLRTFLLASFENFLADERDRLATWRRGGRVEIISMDAMDAEERYRLEPSTEVSPERLFHRRWALALLQRALELLEIERKEAGRGREMEAFRGFLDASNPPGKTSYEDTAAALGWSVNAARVAVHRLRQRYREILRGQIAATLDDESPERVDEEMRALLHAVS